MDLYGLLGVGSHATFQELRAAYRRAALATHPDKGGTGESFRQVVFAFELPNGFVKELHKEATFVESAGVDAEVAPIAQILVDFSTASLGKLRSD